MACQGSLFLITKKKLKLLGLAKKMYEDFFVKSIFLNRTPSRLEARLVYKHTQKPDLLISNAR